MSTANSYMANTILAIERGRVPVDSPNQGRFRENIIYDIITIPRLAIRLGSRIHVHELSELQNPFEGEEEDARPYYQVSPTPTIRGRVVAIRTMEKDTTEFIVENDNNLSTINFAYITVEHIQGVTVHLSIWRRALRAAMRPLLPWTRRAPVEANAVIVEDIQLL